MFACAGRTFRQEQKTTSCVHIREMSQTESPDDASLHAADGVDAVDIVGLTFVQDVLIKNFHVPIDKVAAIEASLEHVKREFPDVDFELARTDPQRLLDVLVGLVQKVSGATKRGLSDVLGQLVTSKLQHELEHRLRAQSSTVIGIGSLVVKNIATREDFDYGNILREPAQLLTHLPELFREISP